MRQIGPSSNAPRPGFGLMARAGIVTLAANLVAGAALVIGAGLAVVFAASLAVVTAIFTLLMALAALVWKVTPRPRPAEAVLEARKVGHSWVVYGWDAPGQS